MSPHMSGDDGLIFVILVLSPLAFGVCGVLSVIALLFRGRVARIAQRLATTGAILVHASILLKVSDSWVDIMLLRAHGYFFMAPIGNALVIAGYLRVRSMKRAESGARQDVRIANDHTSRGYPSE